jgi:uroporphyrinogen-III synthase
MPLIVTRPQPQADRWVAQLRAAGIDAVALPLLRIEPLAEAGPVREAWQALAQTALVAFVSPNAVECFFASKPAGVHWPATTWAGSTGPGTSQALRDHGVPAAALVEPPAAEGRFDSEALWQQLQPLREWEGARVRIVRGEGGRDWLADTLRAQRAQLEFVEAYRRAPPQWSAAEQRVLDAAVAEPQRQVWHFSSSQAIGHLQRLAPAACNAQALAFATHERIAARARAAGFDGASLLAPGVEPLVRALRAQQRCIQSPAP